MKSETTEKSLKALGGDLVINSTLNEDPDAKGDREKRRKRYEEYINHCEAYMNSKERLKRYEEYKNR